MHIGKTGGSSIKHALTNYPPSNNFKIILHNHNVKLNDILHGDKIVFFLRDHISRFVSGFYSRQRQGQPRHYSPWANNEKNAFDHFSTPDKLALSIISSDTKERNKAYQAMESIEHVRTFYRDWLIN